MHLVGASTYDSRVSEARDAGSVLDIELDDRSSSLSTPHGTSNRVVTATYVVSRADIPTHTQTPTYDSQLRALMDVGIAPWTPFAGSCTDLLE